MNNHKSQVERTEVGIEELVQMALQIGAGAIDVVAVSPSDISVEDGLADMCREPRCSYYGLSANCPPYVSGPSGFRDLLKNCEHVLAVKIDVPVGCLLTDVFDTLKLLYEIVAGIEKSAIELGYVNSKAFAAGSCKIIFCREHGGCHVIDGGECRHPQYARPSIEAHGVNVYELNKTAGWLMNQDVNVVNTNQVSTGALYGLVLVD